MTQSKLFTAGACLLALTSGVRAQEDGAIIGGTEVPEGSYKFLISMQTTEGRHFCGGSLIDSKYVMTAAHCVTGGAPENFQIRIDETNLDNTANVRVVKPKSVIPHENYNANRIENDIAVIELETAVTDITPIGLDSSDNDWQSGEATVAGWGLTAGGASSTPAKMMEVNLPIVSDSTCKSGNFIFWWNLKETMVCTGYSNGNKSACNGDSGGPLFKGDEQIGVVSWGARGCTSYSIFTQVNRYYSWLQDKMAGNRVAAVEQQCSCVGRGLDVGATCGNHLNAGFDWCYTNSACAGSTPSNRFEGKHWTKCSVSKLDTMLAFENNMVNTPSLASDAKETFEEEPAAAAPATTSSPDSTPMWIGVGVGVAAAGVASAGMFVAYKTKKDYEARTVIERAEAERRVSSKV